MLDHDTSTVIFNLAGTALLSIPERSRPINVTSRTFKPNDSTAGWYRGCIPTTLLAFTLVTISAAYLSGYAGPPPMVHLRRGETLRRYLTPGLEHGKTFVFWVCNYNRGKIQGRNAISLGSNQLRRNAWSRDGTDGTIGRALWQRCLHLSARVLERQLSRKESLTRVTTSDIRVPDSLFDRSATPPNSKPYGIYETGCKNGLVLRGKASVRSLFRSMPAKLLTQECFRTDLTSPTWYGR